MSYDPRDDAPTTPVRPTDTDDAIAETEGDYFNRETGERVTVVWTTESFGVRGEVECFGFMEYGRTKPEDWHYDPEDDVVMNAADVRQYWNEDGFIKE